MEGASSAEVLDAGKIVTELEANVVTVEAGDEMGKDAVGDEEVLREAIDDDQTATVVCSALSTSELGVIPLVESPLSLSLKRLTEEESLKEEESPSSLPAASLAALLTHPSQYLLRSSM
jgi:hypothetical protein